LKAFTAFEVKNNIDKLDANKATGLDELGPKKIKSCGDFVTQIYSSISR
jgi:hypothetical protein